MNTVLFDLDGTLLPLNNKVFEAEYFKLLTKKLCHLFTPDEAIEYIWKATLEMVINDEPHKLNIEVFMDKFEAITGQDMNNMNELFASFYREEYLELGGLFEPSKYIIDSVKQLKSKGYSLVVATNPLFPLEAVHKRVTWAGLEVSDFKLITSFENMHFCKPNTKYYQEILDIINKMPEECIMVGNDVEEDLAAGKLGIKTYLIEDNILNKRGIEPEADFRGSYEDFYSFVTLLPNAAGRVNWPIIQR